ncbi:hypothetical protein Hdeb2414_s0012g00378781 [Helianthus debilis subsp. tardiflorus]
MHLLVVTMDRLGNVNEVANIHLLVETMDRLGNVLPAAHISPCSSQQIATCSSQQIGGSILQIHERDDDGDGATRMRY